MRKNIGYACVALAGLALVGTACGTDTEAEAVGVGRVARSSVESTAVDSTAVESAVVEAAVVEPVDTAAPIATEVPVTTEAPAAELTEAVDDDIAELALAMVWDGMTAVERSELCEGVDMFGSTMSGEILADGSGGSIDAIQAADFLLEKCGGAPSGDSPGSDADYNGAVTLDFVWSALDAADQASLCDATEILGADAAGVILSEASEGMFTEFESTAFLIEKCM